MSYQYFYLFWIIIFFIIWLILFLSRKDLRHEMLAISIIFGLGGIVSEFTYTQDWWRPLIFTQTSVGIEDFVIGFLIGGICSVTYTVLFHLKLELNHFSLTKTIGRDRLFGNMFLIVFALFFLGMFYIFNLNSFYSTAISYLLGIIVIVFYRRDLIISSMISGIIILFLGSLIYYFLFLLFPYYIDKFWYLPKNWYSHLFLGVPLAEYIWFFLTGAFIGPLYKFVRNKKIVRS